MYITKWFSALTVITLLLCSCSQRPRDHYYCKLYNNIDQLESNLRSCEVYPKGTVSEIPSTLYDGTSITEARVSGTYAEAVAALAEALRKNLNSFNYADLHDIQNSDDYDKWATECAALLQKKAIHCLEIIGNIKSNYMNNPNSSEFIACFEINGMPFPGRNYKVIWMTTNNEMVFVCSPSGNEGFIAEHVLTNDFRRCFDCLHTYGRP